ncbi:hypothetical protein D3C71_2126290 [compost metagenome]
MGIGQRCHQVQVQPFVDHAVIAQARTGQRSLIGVIGQAAAAEMRMVDAAGKAMHVRMPLAL